jgi:hypothetical protein
MEADGKEELRKSLNIISRKQHFLLKYESARKKIYFKQTLYMCNVF